VRRRPHQSQHHRARGAGRARAYLEPILAAALKPLESDELVREVRAGVGLLAGVECVSDAVAQQVCRAGLADGVITRTLARSTIHVSPPFVIEESYIALMADVLAEALDRATGLSPAGESSGPAGVALAHVPRGPAVWPAQIAVPRGRRAAARPADTVARNIAPDIGR
jgi:Aminotransferase class-III